MVVKGCYIFGSIWRESQRFGEKLPLMKRAMGFNGAETGIP